MMDWQQKILDRPEFRLDGLLLVADPDGILNEPIVRQGLIEDGWEFVEYSDAITFRAIYENRYRQLKDARLLARVAGSDLGVVPYDIWKRSYKLELSLQHIFPKLSYNVLSQVDSELLAKVYRAYRDYDGSNMGEKGTQDFILERVYGIYPRNIQGLVSLLAALLNLHYRGAALAPAFAERLAESIPYKPELPVKEYAINRESFFAFLQRQWEKYVRGDICLVPFNENEIRVYVDSLFLEGMLQPVARASKDLPAWARVGLVTDKPSKKQLGKVVENLASVISEASTHRHWQSVCRLLAEGIYWANKLEVESPELNKLRCEAEEAFLCWLGKNYGSLGSLSYHTGPVMVHHVPWYLDAERRRGKQRLALLVMDGMAMDQWLVVKEQLQTLSLNISEASCFAWVPTTTAISRQAMFSGEIPANIAEFLKNTSREDKLWRRFWKNRQLAQQGIYYQKGLGQGNPGDVAETLADSRIRVAGLIVDTLDKLSHGEILGSPGLHSQIRVWLKEGYLPNLIAGLLAQGFHVYLTSDHGNVAAVGTGRPRQGVLVDEAGERVRIYSQEEWQQIGDSPKEYVQWTVGGLPEDFHVLLAKGKGAFVQDGKNVIAHGGASITEVIVPFIHLWKED